jgi:hypothetical protein
MKIRCAHCKRLFVPSRGQRQMLKYSTARRFCSHECKCAAQERRSPDISTPSPPRPDHGFHIHVRVDSSRALQRLLGVLDGCSCELVRVRPDDGRQWALATPSRPLRPGSITRGDRAAAPRPARRRRGRRDEIINGWGYGRPLERYWLGRAVLWVGIAGACPKRRSFGSVCIGAPAIAPAMQTKPGATAFTVTPCWPNSRAKRRVRIPTSAFVAA